MSKTGSKSLRLSAGDEESGRFSYNAEDEFEAAKMTSKRGHHSSGHSSGPMSHQTDSAAGLFTFFSNHVVLCTFLSNHVAFDYSRGRSPRDCQNLSQFCLSIGLPLFLAYFSASQMSDSSTSVRSASSHQIQGDAPSSPPDIESDCEDIQQQQQYLVLQFT